jgi:hypothetical protein
VLPSLLVLWTRYFEPEGFTQTPSEGAETDD